MAKKKAKSGRKSAKKAGKKSGGDHGRSTSVVDALKALDKGGVYDAVEEVQDNDFADIPDGKYQIRIGKAVLGQSKSSERLQVSFELDIVSGDFKGRKLWKHDGIGDEQGLTWFRRGLNRLGHEWPEKASKLPSTLEDLTGSFAQVTARTKSGSEYQNVYFDKALDNIESEEEEMEELEIGGRVSAEFDGETYEGAITALDEENETVTVKFDDGTTETLAADDVTPLDEEGDDEEEAEEEEEEEDGEIEAEFAPGLRFAAEIDGETYEGELVEWQEDEEVWDVKFDDGEEAQYAEDDMTLLAEADADEAEEEDEDEDEEEEAEEEAESGEVTVTFDDEKVTEELQAKATALAEKHEFDADDYGEWSALLADIAEYVGVTGEFKGPKKLIAAIEAAG